MHKKEKPDTIKGEFIKSTLLHLRWEFHKVEQNKTMMDKKLKKIM